MQVRSIIGIALVLVAATLIGAEKAEKKAPIVYNVDLAHSEMGFRVKHLGISKVNGKFKQFEGTISFNPATGTMSDIKVKIDSKSIDTNEPDRDKHLRSADFFDVDKFNSIEFVSTKVSQKGKTPTQIQGNLTLHGVTKPVTLKVEWGGALVDQYENQRLAFSASGRIDRREWGLTWNDGVKAVGGLLVSNDVDLIIEIEGVNRGTGAE